MKMNINGNIFPNAYLLLLCLTDEQAPQCWLGRIRSSKCLMVAYSRVSVIKEDKSQHPVQKNYFL